MADNDDSLFEIVAKFVGVIVIGILVFGAIMVATFPLALMCAWARVKLWDWFAVPYLHVPHVSIWVMYGLGLIANSFYYVRDAGKEEKNKSVLTSLAVWYLSQLIAVGVGWTIHHCFLS